VGDNSRQHLMQGGEVRLDLPTITRTHARMLSRPTDKKSPTLKPPKY
jgi:hypothetical protein